jgi:hypothetical protein
VTFVNILNGATAGFDGSYDAYKLFGDNLIPQIYTTGTDQSQLSINTQPDFTLVPVEYKAGNAGTYKITFGGVSSFNPDQPLFFEDKTTNTAVNIRNAGEFVFTSDGSPATGRFILHFQEVGITEHAETPFQTWIFENQIHIIPKSGTSLVEQLEIFTVTGQLLWATGNVELPVIIQTRPLSIGLYILRIRTNEGIFSQKLYVR